MEYSKKEIEYHKQKLIEARHRVEEACKEDDNSLDVVCNMMGLTVDRYKSVHGIVKIVHYTNKSIANIIKIAIGNNHYEHIEQLTGKYGLYNEFKGYENSGSGYDEPFKMIECNYTYKEVTKEGILAELKDYNIG